LGLKILGKCISALVPAGIAAKSVIMTLVGFG